MELKRRKFTKEFKKDAVELYRASNTTLKEIAESLGIHENVLSRWNLEYDKKNAFPGNGNPKDKEIYELKKEIRDLKEEREILKKAVAIFSVKPKI
jgi:transposase